MSHATYSPSQLHRIISCPGSVSLCKTVPKRPSSKFAEEGTLLHSYTEQTLEMWPESPNIQYESLDHEIAVQAAIDNLRLHVDFNEPNLVRFQELKVTMEHFAGVYGTLDFASISPTALRIADFKFGRGIEVGAYDNPQLLAYLDGFLWMLKQSYPDLYALALTVPWYMHIIQPRIENYPWEQVFPRELVQFNALIDRTLRLAESENPPFKPGIDQCRWCDAGGVCRHRLDQVNINRLEALAAYADIQENKATIAQVEQLLEKKDETVKAFEAMEQYTFLELAKGSSEVTRFKLVRGRSNRTWAPGVDFDFLTNEFSELDETADRIVETKLIGPAQVEKILPLQRRKLLANYIVKPEGKLSLAHITSSKDAVVVNNPEDAFKDMIGE